MSGSPKPRVGVVSFAHYHANFWSEVFAQRGALAGVFDDDVARGTEAAVRYGTRHHAALDALFATCDAVAICSETAQHAPLIAAAAARGLAILCEKPLGVSFEDCRRIEGSVAQHGAWFMQSFPKRFDPVTWAIQRTVASGDLGEVTLVRIRHGHFYGLQPDFRERWYVRQARAGGGALLDEGAHGADLLNLLFGLPATVLAETSHRALGLEVEDLATATFRWESGMLAELTASFTFAAADTSIEIYGTRGTLLVSGVDLASRDITPGPFLRLFREGGERRWAASDLVPQFKRGNFHQQNAIAFLDALAAGAPPPIPLAAGLAVGRMIDAAYRAAATGVRTLV